MKVGLVLSGGGGKGAYEVGVWQALCELDIAKYIKVFSGTSIGAINAALFAQGSIQKALDLWEEVTIDKLIPISKVQLVTRGIGIAIGEKVIQINKKYVAEKMTEGVVSKTGAREIIDRYLDLDVIKENGNRCYATATMLPELKPTYFQVTNFDAKQGKEMIIASASLPHIYDCAEILGAQYVDGGVVDNTPIKPVYEAGCDVIIVVLLSPGQSIDRSLYPNTPIIEIVPKKVIGNILTGTLNLDEQAKKDRIKQGYTDTINYLQPVISLSKLI